MLYLVTGEWIEVGVLLPPEQIVPILDEAILPSLEKLAQWEEEGKIHGGIFPAERAGAWVMEADSSEDVGQFLASLPFWGQVKWHVRALQTMRSTVEREQGVRERLQAAIRVERELIL
jgi:hypothetical protein